MKILIIGGDGYLGWPTAMFLAKKKYQVFLTDNFSKRKIESENGIKPLQPIETLPNRIYTWNNLSKKKGYGKIRLISGDILNQRFLYKLLKNIKPDHIIHYGEQPSAPYSMMGREQAVYSQYNNIIGSLNLLFGVKGICPNSHIIKLGSMGIYGTPNIDIEEGYLKLKYKGRFDKVLFPMKPHSFYHLSKAADSLNLDFVCRVWGLKATDLHQGVVYGVNTIETILNKNLVTSFHYDHIFGTVLNRFMVQAVCGSPLTIYGSGNQKRTFLNINDTLKCIELAIKKPAKNGEYKVRNQFTEVFDINELAELVKVSAKELGIKVKIKKIKNPRTELSKHYYKPSNKSFLKIGLKPIYLNKEFIKETILYIQKYKANIDKKILVPKIKWKN